MRPVVARLNFLNARVVSLRWGAVFQRAFSDQSNDWQALAEGLKQVGESVAKAEKGIGKMGEDITALNASVSNVSTEIKKLKTEVQPVESTVADLKDQQVPQLQTASTFLAGERVLDN